MKMGIVGLGRMGSAIALRVLQAGHEVSAFDPSPEAQTESSERGIHICASLEELAQETRIIFLLVPAGEIVDSVIKQLRPHLKGHDIIVDAGNSNFKDSIRRAQSLAESDIFFLDCGTSGGLQGRAEGFCLMVGGDGATYRKVHPLFAAIATPGALALVGPSGAGHYVKMVHNGIEYALMQSYAEGFQVIKEGHFKSSALDLEELSRIWNISSVIRSWLLELTHKIFLNDQEFKSISGKVGGGQTGLWTVEEAESQKIPTPILKQAVETRDWSQLTGGNYATKIIALMRNEFGGHEFQKLYNGEKNHDHEDH